MRFRLRRWGTLTLGFCSTVAVFGSFLWQLYGPRPGLPLPQAPSSWISRQQLQWARAWCIAGLASLERELGEQTSGLLMADDPVAAQAQLDRTYPRWGARFAATDAFCRHLDDPQLHQALATMQAQHPAFVDGLRQRVRQRRDTAALLARARARLGVGATWPG